MSVPTKEAVKQDVNLLFRNKPASPVADTSIEVSVVGRRCVYLNDYRIAGSKPYYSENIPSYNLTANVRDVITALGKEKILAAMTEMDAERAYYTAYHAQPEESPE